MTNSVTLTEISPGDTADADIIMYNFNQLKDAVDANTQSLTGVTSNKNSANGYCGLDSEANLPSTVLNKVISSVADAIYPVGSIYIGTGTSCPLSSLITGSTWTRVGAGYALWTGNGQSGSGTTTNANYANAKANTTIPEGLPDITGYFASERTYAGGAFSKSSTTYDNGANNVSGSTSRRIDFKASDSSSKYGQSSTVQPRAYVVNVWRRTA
jgi:hypothetical protein